MWNRGQSPTTSVNFSTNWGSRLSWKVRVRCGLSPRACQTRCTVFGLTPTTGARVRVVQCVAAGGEVVVMMVTMRWIVAGWRWHADLIRNVCRLPGLHRQLVDCMPACRWFPSPHRKNQAGKAGADEEQRGGLGSDPDPASATDEGR